MSICHKKGEISEKDMVQWPREEPGAQPSALPQTVSTNTSRNHVLTLCDNEAFDIKKFTKK